MAQPNVPPSDHNLKNPNKTKAPVVAQPVNVQQEERASLVDTTTPAPTSRVEAPQGSFDPSSLLRVGSIPAQATSLQRLNATQGHEAAAHIGQAQGNRHLSTVISTLQRAPSKHAPLVQAKLTVGEPDDQYEQEADEVADQVLRAAAPPPPAGEDDETKPVGLQTKVTVGPAGDRYEQEADRVARQVMTMSTAPVQRLADEDTGSGEEPLRAKPLAASITPLVQRQAQETEAEAASEEPIQAKQAAGGGFAPGAEFEGRLSTQRGGGQPLPTETRTFMESRFGADFGTVRVHTGGPAAQLNREVQARAFTHGSDIYFSEGRYSPGTDAGKELLAHELTHVVQQGGAAQLKRAPDSAVQRQENPDDGE